jgi:hypothetical protein
VRVTLIRILIARRVVVVVVTRGVARIFATVRIVVIVASMRVVRVVVYVVVVAGCASRYKGKGKVKVCV